MAKKNEKLKLTRAEKKQLQELMTRSQQQNAKKVPRTAQATIPYQRMWPDGICRVTDNYYTKTIQFQDINYQLAQNDDKTSIFEGWCDFLNYEDNSQSPMWAYMVEYFAERYSNLAREKLGTNTLNTQLQYSIRLYCYGAVGMTREWLMKDNITPAKTVVQLMFNSMPETLNKLFFG